MSALALRRIAAALDVESWSADTLDEVAEIVRRYGYAEQGDAEFVSAHVGRMADGYMGCAAWSSTAVRDDGTTEEDLRPLVWAEGSRRWAVEECRRLYDAAWVAVEAAAAASSWGQVGHDLWLTRNRHGAGFADGGLPGWAAETLTGAAHRMGETEVGLGDDGLLRFGDCEWS